MFSLTLKIHGKVQDVDFRYYTRKKARELGLSGHVKNEAGGTVTVYAEGEEVALKELADWCRIGPPVAKVEEVEEKWEEINESRFRKFEIYY